MNEEVGIRVLTQRSLFKLLGTLPACRRQVLDNSYNEVPALASLSVLLLDTSYLLLF